MSLESDLDNDVDIYGDLPLIPNEDEELNKLQNDKKKLEEELQSLKEQLEAYKQQNTKLESKCQTLGKNISSLLKTATAEIERKDRMITELRKEKDNVVFRRNRKGGNTNETRAKPENDKFSKSKVKHNYDSNRTHTHGDEQHSDLQYSEHNHGENQCESKKLETRHDVYQSAEQHHKERTPAPSQSEDFYLELDYEDSLESYPKEDPSNYPEHEDDSEVNKPTVNSRSDSPPMTLFSMRQKQRVALKLKEELSKSTEVDNEAKLGSKQSEEFTSLSNDTNSNTVQNVTSSQNENNNPQSQHGNKTGVTHDRSNFNRNEIQLRKSQTLHSSVSNTHNEFRKSENRATCVSADDKTDEIHVDESRKCHTQNSESISPNKPQNIVKTAGFSIPSNDVPNPMKQYKIPKRVRESSVSRALNCLRNRSRSRSLVRSPIKHGVISKRIKSCVRLSPSKCSNYSHRNYREKGWESHSQDRSDRNRSKTYDSHLQRSSPHSTRFSSRSTHRSNSRNRDYIHHNSKTTDRYSTQSSKSRSSNSFTKSELKFCDSRKKVSPLNEVYEKDKHSSHQKAKYSDNFVKSEVKESYRNSNERHHDSSDKRKGKNKDLSHYIKHSSRRSESKDSEENVDTRDCNPACMSKDSTKRTSNKLETKISDKCARSSSTESYRSSKERDENSSHRKKGKNKESSDDVIVGSTNSECKDTEKTIKEKDVELSCNTKESTGTKRRSLKLDIQTSDKCARSSSTELHGSLKEINQDSSNKTKENNIESSDDVKDSSTSSECKDAEKNVDERDVSLSCKTIDTTKRSDKVETKTSDKCARSSSTESRGSLKEKDQDSSHKKKVKNKESSDDVKDSSTSSECKDSETNVDERDVSLSCKTTDTTKRSNKLETKIADKCARSSSAESHGSSKESDRDLSRKTENRVQESSDDVKVDSKRRERKDSEKNVDERDVNLSYNIKDSTKSRSNKLETKIANKCARSSSTESHGSLKEKNQDSSHKRKVKNKESSDDVKDSSTSSECKDTETNVDERDVSVSCKTTDTTKRRLNKLETTIADKCARSSSTESHGSSKERDRDLSRKTKENNKESSDDVKVDSKRHERKDSEKNVDESDVNLSYNIKDSTKSRSNKLETKIANKCARSSSTESHGSLKEKNQDSSHKKKVKNKESSDGVKVSCTSSECTDSETNVDEGDINLSSKTKDSTKRISNKLDIQTSDKFARSSSTKSRESSKESDQVSFNKKKRKNKEPSDDVKVSSMSSECKDSETNLDERDVSLSCKTTDATKRRSNKLETKIADKCARSSSTESHGSLKEKDQDSSHRKKGKNKESSDDVKVGSTSSECKDSEINVDERDVSLSCKTTDTTKRRSNKLETKIADKCARSSSTESHGSSKERDRDLSRNTEDRAQESLDDVKGDSKRREHKDSEKNIDERDVNLSYNIKDSTKRRSNKLETKIGDKCARSSSTESHGSLKEKNQDSSHKKKVKNKESSDGVKVSSTSSECKDSEKNVDDRNMNLSSKSKDSTKRSLKLETKIAEKCARSSSTESRVSLKESDRDSSNKTKEKNKESSDDVKVSGTSSECKDSEKNVDDRDVNLSCNTKDSTKRSTKLETKTSDKCARSSSTDSHESLNESDQVSSNKKKRKNKESSDDVKVSSMSSECKDSERNVNERDVNLFYRTEDSTKKRSNKLETKTSHKCARSSSTESRGRLKESDQDSSNKTKDDTSHSVKNRSIHNESKELEINFQEKDHDSSCKERTGNILEVKSSNKYTSSDCKELDKNSREGNHDRLKDDSSYNKPTEIDDLPSKIHTKLAGKSAQIELKLCDDSDIKICEESTVSLESVLTVQPKRKAPTSKNFIIQDEASLLSELGESRSQQDYNTDTFYYNSLYYKPEVDPIRWHLNIVDVDSSRFVSRRKNLDLISNYTPGHKIQPHAMEISNRPSDSKDSVEKILTDKTNENNISNLKSDASFKTPKPQAISANLDESNVLLSQGSLSEHCEFKRRKKIRIAQLSCVAEKIVQPINKPTTVKRPLSSEEVRADQPVAKRQALENITPTESTGDTQKGCNIEKSLHNSNNNNSGLRKDVMLNKELLKDDESHANTHVRRSNGKRFEMSEKLENKITDISEKNLQKAENASNLQTDKQKGDIDKEEGEISNESSSEPEEEETMNNSDKMCPSEFNLNKKYIREHSPVHSNRSIISKFKLNSPRRNSNLHPRSKNLMRRNVQFRPSAKFINKCRRYNIPVPFRPHLDNIRKNRLLSKKRSFEDCSENRNNDEGINSGETVESKKNKEKSKKLELCEDLSAGKDIAIKECYKNVNNKSFSESSSTRKQDSVGHKFKDDRKDEKCRRSKKQDNSNDGSSSTNVNCEQEHQNHSTDREKKEIQSSNYKQKEHSREIQSETNSSLEHFESPKETNVTKIKQSKIQNKSGKGENASHKRTEMCNSTGLEAEDKRKVKTNKALKNVEENKAKRKISLTPSEENIQKEMNESPNIRRASNSKKNRKLKIQGNSDKDVKPPDKSIEINKKTKHDLSYISTDETDTNKKEQKSSNIVPSPTSEKSNSHTLLQSTPKELGETPTTKLNSSLEESRISQGSFRTPTSNNSFSDTTPVFVSRYSIKRKSRTCKLGDSSVISINISPRSQHESSDSVSAVRDISVDTIKGKNLNTELERSLQHNVTESSRLRPSTSCENSDSVVNETTEKNKCKKMRSSDKTVHNNRLTDSETIESSTVNTHKLNYKTSLDFREKYSSVFAEYSQSSDESSNGDEFVSSTSSSESDRNSDESWRPSEKRKRTSKKSKPSQSVKRGTKILKK